MAKKKTTTTKKKTAPKAAAATSKKTKKASTSKKTTKKAPAKKVTKKAPAKKTDKVTKKPPASKKVTKTTTKKTPAPKKTSKKAPAPAKAPAKKTLKKSTEAAPSKKPAATSKKTTKKTAAKPAPPPPPPPPAAAAKESGAGTKPADNRPSRPRRPKPPAAVMPEGIGGLLSPGGPAPKPLIASADRVDEATDTEAEKYPTKSPFNKRELEKLRHILLQKRAEVLHEVTGLEGDALKSGGSGNLSKTPQHMADAGSDAADQTISLDLAAAERNLIKEIDAALQRIRDGVFGLCEKTGKPIRTERLEELPWARYSIEAARQMEGRR